MLKGVPEHCCQSSLWDRFVRDNVTDNKLSEQVMWCCCFMYMKTKKKVELY